jgi:heme oxygenase
MNILESLKVGTHSLHLQLENHPRLQRVVREDLQLDDYQELLTLLLGYYVPFEEKLAGWMKDARPAFDFDFEARRKVPLLLRDLQTLGRPVSEPADVPHCTNLPSIDSPSRVLGCLYALEGATLGGKVVAKCLKRSLNLDADGGASFYHGYGPDTGPMWHSFSALLTACIAREDIEAAPMIEAARETFSSLDDWLSA